MIAIYRLAYFLLSILIATPCIADVPSVLPPKEELFKIQKDDVVLGCENAENIIIEYSSLACPHCAEYYANTFPRVKSELINKCKVKYVYRDFPTTRSALKASAMVRCISTNIETNKVDADSFMNLMQTLFRAQASWAFSNDYEKNLVRIIGITGSPNDKITSCLQNKELATAIASSSFVAMKTLQLSHSPAIFINGIEVPITTYESISSSLKK